MDWRGRIVLVKPPLARGRSYYLSPPAGLLVVAAALEARGLDPIVVDMALDFAEGTLPAGPGLCETAAQRLAGLDADIYGFTIQCVSLPIALEIARRLRALRPGSRVVFGGHHASLVGEALRERFPFVDHVVVGRIEPQLTEPARRWIVPAYSKAPAWKRYVRASSRPVGLVEVASGCSFGCRFCSIPVVAGHRAEHKPVEMVLHEAAWWVAQGCRDIYLVGDTFTLDRVYTASLLDALLAARLGLQWGVATRVDLVSPALLEKMSQAGCRAILYGIESAESRTRRRLGKGGQPYPDLLEFLKWHVDLNIRPALYFIVNLPDDTTAGLEETLAQASRLSVVWPGVCHFQRYRPVPGTELAREWAGRLIPDTDTAYARPVWETVGEAANAVWDIVAGNPDLCSSFYTTAGPAPAEAASALDWVGDRVFEIFPLTLATLAEQRSLLGLFSRLGQIRRGRQWLGVSGRELAGFVEDWAAGLSPELAGVALYEYRRWQEAGGQPAVSSHEPDFAPGLDLEMVRQAASTTNPPLVPASAGRRRPRHHSP